MGLLDIITGGRSGKASKLMGQAVDEFRKIGVPDIASQRILLEQLVSQGELSPQQAETILQEQSSLGSYSADPRLRDAQLAALGQLQNIGAEGGLTAMDRAALQEANMGQDARARGAREAILQNMAARGMSGSGQELIAQLTGQQAQAQQGALTGLQTGALARQRALDAILGAGQLGGQMEEAQFGQAAQKAEAQDIINRFNAANRQQVMNQNVMDRNRAMAANLANRQDIANQNVGLRNQQQMHNKGLIQQRFQNQMQRAGGMAGALGNQAQLAQAQGGQIMGLVGGALQAGGSALGGYLGGGASPVAAGGAPNVAPPLDPSRQVMGYPGLLYRY